MWEKKNLKFDPKEMGCEAVDWIHVAQDKDQRRGTVNNENLDSVKDGVFFE